MYTPLYFNNYLKEQTVFSGLTLFICFAPPGTQKHYWMQMTNKYKRQCGIILLAIAWLILVTSLLWKVINIFFILTNKAAQNVLPDNLKAILLKLMSPENCKWTVVTAHGISKQDFFLSVLLLPLHEQYINMQRSF